MIPPLFLERVFRLLDVLDKCNKCLLTVLHGGTLSCLTSVTACPLVATERSEGGRCSKG